jgi:uncharacterized protein YqhQ
MNFVRHNLKFLGMLQLLPALESGEETTLVGGQAVMEGVMMRSPHAWGIAVRKPDGSLCVHSEGLDRPSDKHKWMAWPVVRGVVTLGQAMTLGYKALQYSGNVMLEEEQKDTPKEKQIKFSGWVSAANIVLSLLFFIGMYKFLPLLATKGIQRMYPATNSQWATGLIDGLIRLALFLFFIWLMSLMKDIRRVFQYHGGEHKTVFAFEGRQTSGARPGDAGFEPVSVGYAQSFPTWHPRCGTSFLITLMLICIPIYMFIPKMVFWKMLGIRIALLPVIVGVSYEIIRYAARKRSSLFALMTQPGLWLQRITTQPCDDSQVECAIRALDEAMELEKARGGELVIA